MTETLHGFPGQPAGSGRQTVVFVGSGGAMGGVEMSTLHLVRHLDRERWRAVVICPEDGDLTRACRGAGVTARVVPRPPFRSTSLWIGNGRRAPNPLAWGCDVAITLMAARRLARELATEKPHLVVTKGMFAHFYGGLATRRLGIPCLWHVQDWISERCWGTYRRVFGGLAGRLPTLVVVDGAPIARHLPPQVREKTRVVHNGVDTEVFSPAVDGAGFRRELGISPKEVVIGNVARLTPWKGQHYLLEAFARVAAASPNARLLLVGSPLFDSNLYERRLRKQTAELGLNHRVIFAGYRSDLPQAVAAMDLFAYSSVEKDTSPLALLSAMAAGRPITGFDIEGVREVVGEGEHRWLVPPKQVEPLAGALAVLLGDEGLRRRLGKAARRRAEAAFSLQRHVVAMEESFLEALGNRRQPGFQRA